MSRNGNTRPPAAGRLGFTAIELLVAIAIFITLMAGVTGLFTGIIRTVQGSYATMDAMENIRASMAVFEADLKQSFARSDLEDSYAFYGEPTGFVYIGADRTGKLSRVTYVLHVDPEQTESDRLQTQILPLSQLRDAIAHYLMIDRDGDGYTDFQFRGVPDQPLRIDWADPTSVSAAEGALGDPIVQQLVSLFPVLGNGVPTGSNASDFQVEVSFDGRRGILLRYEEPGKNSLDDLDIGLNGDDLRDRIPMAVYLDYAGDSNFVARPIPAKDIPPLRRALRASLWLQRMRGGFDAPFLLPTAPKDAQGMPPVPAFWAEDGAANGKTLKDYVVIRNVLVTAWLCEPSTLNWIMGNEFNGTPVPVPALDLGSFFYYGDEYDVSAPCFNALWNVPFLSRGLDPRIASADNPKYSWLAWQLIAGNDAQGNLVYPGTLLASRYWLYRYPPENWSTLVPPLHPIITESGPGNPLDARLPAWITPGLWFVADAPGPQGQPFCRWVSQRIDLPVGYMRGSF